MYRSRVLERLFGHRWPLIGVVHLPALPGSPFATLSFDEVRARALADAEALLSGGFDGLIVENFGDRPFFPDAVEPHTVAAMALVVRDVVALAKGRAIGVNVLRNDVRSALGIAAATGAAFVRVNVHVGAMVTDQGIVEGRAHETLRYRKSLGAPVAILADVLVKHARPLGQEDLEASARDTFRRAGADGLIVTGSGTGEAADLERVRRARAAVPEAPVLVGSGVTAETMVSVVRAAHSAIVGTATKHGGRVEETVDQRRVAELVQARDSALM